jgi:hypothetical protein
LILFGFPNSAPQHPRAGRGKMTAITIAAVLVVLLSARGWRARLFLAPLWLAILCWLYGMWAGTSFIW